MTAQQPDGIEAETICTEDMVTAYLEDHPEYFVQHPDLVESLKIPHDCKGAVSLVEHQVELLQNKNRSYRKKLRDLVEVARENDRLNEKMHALSIELISATNLDDIVIGMQDVLRNEFKADVVTVRLIGDSAELNDHPCIVPSDEPSMKIFESFFRGQRPICGKLKPEQLDFLFGDKAKQIGSTALVPLVEGRQYGLIAIGSYDEDHYQPNHGTVFLRQIGAMISRALKPFMAA